MLSMKSVSVLMGDVTPLLCNQVLKVEHKKVRQPSGDTVKVFINESAAV